MHSEDGTIPADAVREIKSKAAFTPERISEIEKTTDHDVIAFTTNLAENIGPASRFVHYGLTSSDVVDTANAIMLQESCDILLAKIDAMLPVLKRRALEFKDTPQIGRTHGIHAEPTSFGSSGHCGIPKWSETVSAYSGRKTRSQLERSAVLSVLSHIWHLMWKKGFVRNWGLRLLMFDTGNPTRSIC